MRERKIYIYIYIYYIRRESFCSSKRAKLREKADAFRPPLETEKETLKTIYPRAVRTKQLGDNNKRKFEGFPEKRVRLGFRISRTRRVRIVAIGRQEKERDARSPARA